MTLDQRLTHAVRHVAAGVTVPDVDLDAVRARAAVNRRRTVSLAVTVVVAAVIAAGGALGGGRESSAPAPPSSTGSASSVPSPSPSSQASPSSGASRSTNALPPIKTGRKHWQVYRSTQYGFDVGHPPAWSEIPASRVWEWETDVRDALSPAQEAFRSPAGTIRASAWQAPLAPGTRIESTADIVEWVESYCKESGNSPCTGIADRAVDLCLEKWDCHPGLLVPFKHDVQAFFSAGIYDAGAMTVVAVWRAESAPAVVRYGGSQRLLEGFLSTMEVWPSTTPRWQRR